MNKKTPLLALAAFTAAFIVYQAGAPRPAASGLRDAVAGGTSALDQLPGSADGMKRAPALVPTALAKPAVSAFKTEPAFDANVPADVHQQMIKDLTFVGTIAGRKTSPLHNGIFGPVSGESYARFFGSRVKSVGLNGCGSDLAVACVIPYMSNTKMWLTKNYIKFSHPQIARAMIVYHESRHTEAQNKNWHHADCPNPFTDANGNDVHSIWTGASLVGEKGACDVTPYGSYGSSLIMLKNIQRYCSNCTEKVMMDAGLYADDQLNRIVDAKAKSAIVADIYK